MITFSTSLTGTLAQTWSRVAGDLPQCHALRYHAHAMLLVLLQVPQVSHSNYAINPLLIV
jgi:hypothetical protein